MIAQYNIITQVELFQFPQLKFKSDTDEKQKLDTFLTGLFDKFDNEAVDVIKFLSDLLIGAAMEETRRDMVEIDLDDHKIKKEDALPEYIPTNHKSLDSLLQGVNKSFSSVFQNK